MGFWVQLKLLFRLEAERFRTRVWCISFAPRAMVWIPDHIFYKQKALKSKMSGKGGKGKGKTAKAVVKSKVTKHTKRQAGKKGTRTPFSELSEERKEEIRAKHEARAMEEGREEDSSGFHFGTLLKRHRRNGWIQPSKPGKFPDDVKEKLKDMTAKQRL